MAQIEEVPIGDIRPYEKNPRINDGSVGAVANSIKAFGFRAPIIVDGDGIIIAGHTRYKAAKKLGLKRVPVIYARDMTPAQVEAYRIADNSAGSASEWDLGILADMIPELDFDMADFGLDLFSTQSGPVFGQLDRMMGEKDADYQAFEDKFKPKYTTDDCFTPPAVYDTLLEWVRRVYGIPEDRRIVRPFYPGADYTQEDYPEGCLVLDNPPFSITSEIVKFYTERGIDFFLFINHLTACQPMGNPKANLVVVGVPVVFENGANLPVSFITNMGDNRVEVRGDLFAALSDAQPSEAKELGRYKFPPNIATAASLGRLSKYGAVFSIKNIAPIKRMENGPEIFGGGILMSDHAAELESVEREKAEREKVNRENVIKHATKYELSEKERRIVETLNAMEESA